MCGFVGLLTVEPVNNWQRLLVNMADTLVHRGPDEVGHWYDSKFGVGLAHRRLSVVDLAPTGSQPMESNDGRYVMVYTGEVYNHSQIRRELGINNHFFKGHSDTEAMLSAISTWGLEEALEKFIGMYAFALWDRKEETLHVVRDRIGIKPVYYFTDENRIAFSSELKAFFQLPQWQPILNDHAAFDMLQFGYVSGFQSILQNVKKLEPGHILKVSKNDGYFVYDSPKKYWSLRDFACKIPDITDERDAQFGLKELLNDSISLQQEADVPLGAFLSGS